MFLLWVEMDLHLRSYTIVYMIVKIKKKKILIAGDSFATDWTKKYEGIGWVNMLCKDFDVTNIVLDITVSNY